MVTYEAILDEINRRLSNDEITMEQANDVNELAYIDYVLCEGIDLEKIKGKIDRKLDHEKTLAKKEVALNNIKRKLKAGKDVTDDEIAAYKALKMQADAIKDNRDLKKTPATSKKQIVQNLKNNKPVSDEEIDAVHQMEKKVIKKK